MGIRVVQKLMKTQLLGWHIYYDKIPKGKEFTKAINTITQKSQHYNGEITRKPFLKYRLKIYIKRAFLAQVPISHGFELSLNTSSSQLLLFIHFHLQKIIREFPSNLQEILVFSLNISHRGLKFYFTETCIYSPKRQKLG